MFARAKYVDGWSRAGTDHLLPHRGGGITLEPQLRLITMLWQAQAPHRMMAATVYNVGDNEMCWLQVSGSGLARSDEEVLFLS